LPARANPRSRRLVAFSSGKPVIWLHRLLEQTGVRNYIIDPASVQVDRRARRVKTDNIDAAKLLCSLMAYLRGEPKVWSVLRVVTLAEEDDRRLHRERDRLINERVRHGNRVKGLCALHGIYHYELLRSDRMKRLEQLGTGDGRQLPSRLKAEIRPPLEQIIRGSLFETYKRCGRSSRHCRNGPGHGPRHYLSTVARTGERPRLGHVPNATYPQVAEFLANYLQLKEMLNEICAINAELLRHRESLD
jgi:hypothetical protein